MGTHRVLYVDCFSGVAGDMMLGALLHLGVPIERVRAALETLPIDGWALEARPGEISGIGGVDVQVTVGGLKERTPHHHGTEPGDPVPRAAQESREGAGGGHSHGTGHSHGHSEAHSHGHSEARSHGHSEAHSHGHSHSHSEARSHGHIHTAGHVGAHGDDHEHGHGNDHGRTMREIRQILLGGRLEAPVLALALDAFGRLAKAEGKVHGVPPDEVHFHEVGALDAIVDIVGTAAALHALGVDEVVSAPPPLGRGFVQCAHGRLPLPAPATVEILRGAPVRGDSLEAELVTPTGAALLRAMTTRFGLVPDMTVERIGYGLGDARWPDRPNLLRLVLGHRDDSHGDQELVIEANIDDMSPEVFGPLCEALLADGALDAWLCPIQMKKGRPGVLLSALVAPDRRGPVVARILRETTTLGVRIHAVERTKLARRSVVVETPWGPVRVKQGIDGDAVLNEAPELEDCLALARAHGVPLKEVLASARTSQRAPETREPKETP